MSEPTAEEKVIQSMKDKSKDAGIPSVFPDDDPALKADEPAPKETPKADEPPKETPKADEPPKDTVRQPRISFRERIEKAADEKHSAEIKDLKTKLEAFEKSDKSKVDISDLEADIKESAKALGVDEEQMKAIVSLARKGTEKEIADLRTKLSDKETSEKKLQEEKDLADQDKIFETDFKEVLPAIKVKYPNASQEQIDKAFEAMGDLAFTEKYHNVDLDYIFLKEAESFEKILFSPKQKGFESDSTHEGEVDKDEDTNPFAKPFEPKSFKDIETMTKKMEKFQDDLPDNRFSIH